MANDDKIREDLEELKEEFAELRDLTDEYSDAVVDEGKRKFQQTKRKLSRRSEELLDELMPVIEKYQDSGRVAVERVENKVCDNPLLALAVAFGAGMIIGKLLDNGRR